MAQRWAWMLLPDRTIRRTRSIFDWGGSESCFQPLLVELECIRHLPRSTRQHRILIQRAIGQQYCCRRQRRLRPAHSLFQAISTIFSPRFSYRRRVLRGPLHSRVYGGDSESQASKYQSEIDFDRERSHRRFDSVCILSAHGVWRGRLACRPRPRHLSGNG